MKTIITLLFVPLLAIANPLQETRYCGTPKRSASGEIVRSQRVLNAFKVEHPCPSTGLATGSCKGWAINHVIPLACGGFDAVSNMQWLPISIKSTHPLAVDKFERNIYQANVPIAGTNNCINKIVKAE